MSSHFSKPLATQSADNHSAPLWVVTILCLIITTIGVATRLFVRFKALGVDDYVILAGALVGVAQFATIIDGLLQGLARSTDSLSEESASLAGNVRVHLLAMLCTRLLTSLLGVFGLGSAVCRHLILGEALRAMHRPANPCP